MERSLSCDSCVRTFCGIGRFITVFTGARHLFLSRARWIKSAPLLCASFKTCFNADCTRTCSTQCCVILRCRADGSLSAVVSSALKTLCISFPYRFKTSKWFLSSPNAYAFFVPIRANCTSHTIYIWSPKKSLVRSTKIGPSRYAVLPPPL